MTIRTVRNLRRGSQVTFFSHFCLAGSEDHLRRGFQPRRGVRRSSLPYPVSIALEFDPLAALMTLSGQRDPLQGLALVVGDSGAHHLYGALLLRLDMSPGDA